MKIPFQLCDGMDKDNAKMMRCIIHIKKLFKNTSSWLPNADDSGGKIIFKN